MVSLYSANGADHYVRTDATGPVSPYSSWATATPNINDAVSVLSAGETCWVSNGTYTITGELSVSGLLKSVNGRDVAIIDGGYPASSNRVVNLGYHSTIDGFTLKNGYFAGNGAGINTYDATILNCIVEDCHATGSGGAINLYIGTVSNCIVRNNYAGAFGGGINSYKGKIYNCDIYTNIAQSQAGGCRLNESEISDSDIYDNTANGDAAAGIHAQGGATISRCNIYGNTLNGSKPAGAGVYVYQSGSIFDSTISNNVANVGTSKDAFGGGVVMYDGNGIISNCVVCNNNSASGLGGGVTLSSGGRIYDSEIRNNRSGKWGGGVYMTGSDNTNLLYNCQIYGNSVTNPGNVYDHGNGGGVYIGAGEIQNCVISNNTADSNGGGVMSYMYPNRGLIENCVITKNRCQSQGGGLYFYKGAITIRNSIISGNESTNNYGGGGIYAGSTDGVCVENCTIVRNHANSSAGGLYCYRNQLYVTNTIIYHNTRSSSYIQSDIYSAASPTITYSCSPDLTDGVDHNVTGIPRFKDSGSGSGINAVFGDYRLSSTASPCVDSGIDAPWMTSAFDLNGDPRLNGTVDMGAYELVVISGTVISIR
jgi:hypothetical protein